MRTEGYGTCICISSTFNKLSTCFTHFTMPCVLKWPGLHWKRKTLHKTNTIQTANNLNYSHTLQMVAYMTLYCAPLPICMIKSLNDVCATFWLPGNNWNRRGCHSLLFVFEKFFFSLCLQWEFHTFLCFKVFSLSLACIYAHKEMERMRWMTVCSLFKYLCKSTLFAAKLNILSCHVLRMIIECIYGNGRIQNINCVFFHFHSIEIHLRKNPQMDVCCTKKKHAAKNRQNEFKEYSKYFLFNSFFCLVNNWNFTYTLTNLWFFFRNPSISEWINGRIDFHFNLFSAQMKLIFLSESEKKAKAA